MNEVIAAARARGRSQLTEVEAGQLLSAAGVSVAETRLATTADEAVAAAEALGFPLVMKVVSPDIAHKSDIGGVVVGVKDAEGVRATFDQINAAVKSAAPNATVDGLRSGRASTRGVPRLQPVAARRRPAFLDELR